MYLFRHCSNVNWNCGAFERPSKNLFPKYGIAAESKEEFFDFLRAKGMTKESNEYLDNQGYYLIQQHVYSGKKNKGCKVLF